MKKFLIVSAFFLLNLAVHAGPFGEFEGEYKMGHPRIPHKHWKMTLSLKSDGRAVYQYEEKHPNTTWSITCTGSGDLNRDLQIMASLNCTATSSLGQRRYGLRLRINMSKVDANANQFRTSYYTSRNNGQWKGTSTNFIRLD